MLSLRILGGPVPRGEKLLIDVTPSTIFEAMFPLIQQRLGEFGIAIDDMMGGLADQYDVVELQFVEGGKAKPCRTLSLQESPKSAKLSAPAILLRLKQQATTRGLTSSGSFTGAASNNGSFGIARSPIPAAISPTNSSHSQPVLLPPINSAIGQRRLSSDTFGSDYMNMTSPPSTVGPSPMVNVASGLAGGGRRTTIQQSLGAARTSREKLAIMYNVSLGDQPRMVCLDRILRRAQVTGRVEDYMNMTSPPSTVGPSPMVNVASGLAGGGRRTTIQQSLGAARTSREKLAIMYNVSLGDQPRMVCLDRILRRAQVTGRVEWLIAVAEKALLGVTPTTDATPQAALPVVTSASSASSPHRFMLEDPTSEFTVNEEQSDAAAAASPAPGSRLRNLLSMGGGSPSHLLRKMRSSGMLPQRAEEKRTTTLSITTMNMLLQRIHRDCSAALTILFTPEHSLTSRIQSPPLPGDFKTFVFEAGMTPRAAVATLLYKLFEFKYVRRDFEKFEQIERFRGEKAEFLRFEATTNLIIQKMFYAHWCTVQQGYFSVVEQNQRLTVVLASEHTQRQALVAAAFQSFEYAIRKDYVEAAEERHRWQYVSYHMQTREHFARRVVVQKYWIAQRLLELERDFAMAAQVMMRIFRRALVGYRELALLKLVDLETTYRRLMWKREWTLRVALFETQEQLYRHWLDETILTWLYVALSGCGKNSGKGDLRWPSPSRT
ncbi:Hypothetical protein, putative [Bodo saltans]|uniref:Uncharacterized protein n=1 Tax=Bodo saltans TaxID=75058 RepID=A0A0S4J6Z4_BODSA|nr:Hypothetical protein, putative [Bodo saltans]|eukprot:CUG85434.1 Hypothetical protein, putative [Bodo saltans]